jgi:polyisoprenoid-binding protein YceI
MDFMKTKLEPLQHPSAVTGALIALLALFGASIQSSFAQTSTNAPANGAVRFESVGGASSCVVEGGSTLHNWKMESKILSGSIQADEGFPDSATAKATVQRLRVPLRTLKSDKAAMDNTMQEKMDVVKYPNVEYNLIELKRKSLADAKGAIQFDAVGTLTIYGKTLTNTMPVTIEKKDGKITVIGSTPIKISDYGIPPITAFGMSVKDDLKISFNWVTAPKAKTPAP